MFKKNRREKLFHFFPPTTNYGKGYMVATICIMYVFRHISLKIYEIPTTIERTKQKKKLTPVTNNLLAHTYLCVYIYPTENKNQIFVTHFFFVFFFILHMWVRGGLRKSKTNIMKKVFPPFFISNSIFILLYFYFNKKNCSAI